MHNGVEHSNSMNEKHQISNIKYHILYMKKKTERQQQRTDSSSLGTYTPHTHTRQQNTKIKMKRNE